MYFWRIRNLVRLLAEREPTERETFQYFFANSVLLVLVNELPDLTWNHWDTATTVATTVIAILGLLYCYRSNGGSAGHSFLPRFVALMWVVKLRVVVLIVILASAVAGVELLLDINSDETQWWDVLFVTVLEALVYARVGKHLRTVNALRRQAAGSAPGMTAVIAPQT